MQSGTPTGQQDDVDDQAEQLLPDAWREMIAQIGDDEGYWEPLGNRHAAFFADAGQGTLLVSFEDGHAIRESGESQLPEALRVARKHGWSCLTLIAEGETWWRDPAVFRFFDRQVDDAFFEDFGRVVFYGSGVAGYAAAAYSVAAPGATVLTLAPRATMDARVREWDHRHPVARRLDFAGRYAFAPDMTEGAGQTFVAYDPTEAADAMHASLFQRPWATFLRMRRLGGRPEVALRRMGILDDLIVAAAEGTLTPLRFAQMLRVRRSYAPYLKRLLSINANAESIWREAMVCRSVVRRLRGPAFIKRLAELERMQPGIAGAAPAPGQD
jgi:hypothetical protein